MPSSEIGFSALSAELSSISLCAAPDGIIGKQFSVLSTRMSAMTARSTEIISLMTSSNSPTDLARRPTAPNASASFTKSGSESM